jgi:hypothetical protein
MANCWKYYEKTLYRIANSEDFVVIFVLFWSRWSWSMITRFHWHARCGGGNLLPLQGTQESYRVKNDPIRALRVLNSLLKTIGKINLLILIAFIQILIPPIVNREEGLEAGGVAKLCYCSLSRDNTGASKSI